MSVALSCPHCGEAIVEQGRLTRTEKALLKALRQYVERHDARPTFETIAAMMDWSSLGTVHEYMHKLADKGRLVFADELRDRRGPWAGWEIVE